MGELTKQIREKGKPGLLPYLEIGDVDIGTKEYSYKDKPSIVGCLVAKKGNILISRVRPTRGAITMVKEDSICVSSAFTILESDQNLLLNKYLFYIIAYNKSFLGYLEKIQKGTSYPSCRETDILKFKIPVTSLPEQKHIVEFFEKANTLRNKRQEAAELSMNIIQSVFKEMFGDLAKNDKKWTIKKLSELGIWSSGGTPSRKISSYFTGDIDWYTTGELNSRYLYASKEKITLNTIKQTSAKLFKAGSLLVGMYDTAAFKLGILKKDSASNQACANIFPHQEICSVDWLYSAFITMKLFYLTYRRGIRQNNLNLKMIKNFNLPVPPAALQYKFADIVQKIEKIKEKQYESKKQIDNLFNFLMQRYFNEN